MFKNYDILFKKFIDKEVKISYDEDIQPQDITQHWNDYYVSVIEEADVLHQELIDFRYKKYLK